MSTEINLLTSEDIRAIYKPNFTLNTLAPIKRKLDLFNPPINHVLDCNLFNTVYATSDIHADFRKFVQILKKNNIIETEIDPYAGDEIYDPLLVSDFIWIAGPSVLIVIVGDLVDGKRNYGRLSSNCDDIRGSFELLLHAFIYNLRIKANMNNSEVLFTFGNHDFHTVISNDINRHMINTYVTNEAIVFFGNNDIRKEALLDFYKKSPYILLSMENNSVKEVAFIHGGLHSDAGQSFTTYLSDLQTEFNSDGAHLEKLDSLLIPLKDGLGMSAPIWSRYYSESSEQTVCKTLESSKYNTIVVGHCCTNNALPGSALDSIVTNNQHLYSGCDRGSHIDENGGKKGCVVFGCGDIPRVVFVDTSLSQSQRYPEQRMKDKGFLKANNEERVVEILKLSRDSTKPATPYYNIVQRVTDDDGTTNDYPVRSHEPLSENMNTYNSNLINPDITNSKPIKNLTRLRARNTRPSKGYEFANNSNNSEIELPRANNVGQYKSLNDFYKGIGGTRKNNSKFKKNCRSRRQRRRIIQ